MALRARLRDTGWFSTQARAEPKLAALLDLVALGTVADMVPLDYTNRILVAQGMARIRAAEAKQPFIPFVDQKYQAASNTKPKPPAP